MRYCTVLLVIAFFLCGNHFCLKGNNVKLDGMVKVMDVTSGVATLELNLSWENSWRDDFNWDAVWLFLKFKPAGGEWAHVNLQDVVHTATNGYEVMNAKNGSNVTGVYIYPGSNGTNKRASTKVTLKWACGTAYTKSSFDRNEVFIQAQAIEMVYIPYGAYYVGDGFAAQSLRTGNIDENVVKQGVAYSASSVYNTSFSAERAVPGTSGSWCSLERNKEEWWQVDFGIPRKLDLFHVGVAYAVLYGYLEGSDTGQADDWTVLWSGGDNCWPVSSTYPLPGEFKIENPGAYRYYRLRTKSNNYSGIYNVYMHEDDKTSGIIYNENQLTLSILNNATRHTVGSVYPKGYKGFYVMKYELSQEQYVAFLNTLTRIQQETLLGASLLSGLKVGEYIFGNASSPSFRNGIVLRSNSSGWAYLFDNDLNGNRIFGEDGDGRCIACNYMSLNDMLAYASWSGLRPMSELEYERACRTPFPQEPEKGEYAWNSNEGRSAVISLTASGRESEKANDASNVNACNSLPVSLRGPVRCGIFARDGSFQQAAGATYYGVMEMSGNLQECVVGVTYSGFSKEVNGQGSFKTSVWNASPVYYGVRGGSFAGEDSLLRVSDRSGMTGYFSSVNQRDSSVGFRLVRTIEEGIVSVSPGTISLSGSPCPGVETTIMETTAASVSGMSDLVFTYLWSVKIGSADYVVIPGETESTLRYRNFKNNTAYQFKRKAICALGEAETETESVTSLISTTLSMQPQDTNATCGLVLSVIAEGSSLEYQWRKDGIDIPDATSASYTKTMISSSDAGEYSCQVKGNCGSMVSDIALVVVNGCVDGTLIDTRDGQVYKTRVMPNGQEWMVENLRFGKCNATAFNNYAKGSIQNQIADGYWGVCIKSTVGNGGNLYNWQGAMNSESAAYNGGNPSGNVDGNSPNQWRGICPEGWHIPSGGKMGELQQLYIALCSDVNKFYPGIGFFEGVLAGRGSGSSVTYTYSLCDYWGSTSESRNGAAAITISKNSVGGFLGSNVGRWYGFAVRCVKDYEIKK